MKREDALQKAVARLLDSMGLDWFHPANGEARNAITGAKLKAFGVKAGVPDCMIFNSPFYPADQKFPTGIHRHHNGLAIELKAIDAKGRRPKPRPNQLDWHDRLRRNGWRVEICYNIDEVLAMLRECYPGLVR